MNALLVPTSKSFHVDICTKKKRILKTSIADARKSFILQVACMNDLHVQIQIKVDNHYKTKETLQPLICVIGGDQESKEILCIFQHLL